MRITLTIILGPNLVTARAIALQHKAYGEFRTAIDLNIKKDFLADLQEPLTSHSVLQNKKRLDLIFLKKGGLCATLKEKCRFYVDHSGVIKDSMSKLRKRLDKRKRDREAHQGWFKSWFGRSPWTTTLISSLMGPFLVLLLLLIKGPCVLNK